MTEEDEGAIAALMCKYEVYGTGNLLYRFSTTGSLTTSSSGLLSRTDGSVPNTLIITNCDVVKQGVAIADDISQVFIWDLEAQPTLDPVNGAAESCPDLILTDHRENAEFALAMFPTEPFVLSGGQDKAVVLWSIQDYITSLGLSESGSSPKLGPRGVFEGHDATVEDVQFCPSSAQEFCSVGDDSGLILWDAHSGNSPVIKVEKVHDDDLHCVDWNAHNVNLILTGSADQTVRLFDHCKLTAGGVASPIRKFKGHIALLFSIQVRNNNENARAKARRVHSGLFFRHALLVIGTLQIWRLKTCGLRAKFKKSRTKSKKSSK